ncbi:CGNR zinc finger domain-containing protein [Actinoplanes sp. NPDC049596]|uniref:CGNR zinc finger domain-containing protein n=1 Tax=unclassified Actinoplanes TaxID=2626549 RepID=UPI00342F1641
MRIVEMTAAEVVALVNESGTLPCRMDGRAPAFPELTPLADELHAIFATADAAARARQVTALLTLSAVRPELTGRGDALVEGWTVGDPAQAARAAAALALRHQLAAHPGRIGVCADDRCEDVYVDASPAGKRRFCCLTCQNRARAAAFRRRHASS